MNKLVILFLSLLIVNTVRSATIIWDNSVEFDNILQDSRAELVRMPNQFFIFPGTKWCGTGNVAENDDDFGTERDTDKCCRNHDYCPDVIEGYETKHNLSNPSFWSRVHCSCDEEFRKCLKSVNTKTATQVGTIYFTGLGTQCFKKYYPIESCKQQIYFPRKKCVQYTFDTNGKKKYQWFDIPNF